MTTWYDPKRAWPAHGLVVLARLVDGSMALACYDEDRKMWTIQPAFTAHYESHNYVVAWRLLPDD